MLLGRGMVECPTARAQGISPNQPGPDRAAEILPDDRTPPSRWTYGAQIGFALENNIPNNISHIALLIAQPHVGLTLFNFGTPRIPASRFGIEAEGILGNAVHPGGRMLGTSLLFRLDGRPTRRAVPYFDWGAGVLHTNLATRAPELSGHLQFIPQAGLGIQYFVRPRHAVVLEYRYVHMSNAGIREPNHGWNGSMISVGYQWLVRPHLPRWHALGTSRTRNLPSPLYKP
jgi:lipid A 3-O-deacylase PagL